MATTTKSRRHTESEADLETIMGDIASLKADIGALADKSVSGVGKIVQDATTELSDEAERLYSALVAKGERSVKAIGRRVEDQPITSLVIAFAAGWIGSRLLR